VISTPVTLLVLLSALMHAGWNYLIKASPDRLLDSASLAAGGGVLAACALPFLPPLEPNAYPWLAATLLIHAAYFVTLAATYGHADLSLAYPLMRGLAPLLVALAAPLFGDPLTPGLLAGVGLLCAGILLPVVVGLRHRAIARRGLTLALAVVAMIVGYTIIDGVGVRSSGSAAAYVAWLFFLEAWIVLAITLRVRGRQTLQHLRHRWALGLGASTLSTGSYAIVLWAMTTAPIPAVAALRETSVIFAALLGTWLLKEQMGRWRLAGAMLVALGGATIKWA
jgi:drug/metabolite transporter (DMT)-like permease